MKAKTLPAHFDGEHIRLDEPCELEPNTRLLVTVLPEEQQDEEREDWLYVSGKGLARAYNEEKVEYSTELIKEPNPDYLTEKR
jgi:hypothetical protein